MDVFTAPILTLIFIWITTCGAVSRIPAKRTEHVCHSIDIRNRVDEFQRLANCTVIEGSLQILLIDHGEPSEYEPLSFPLLTEITNFLLLYRVYGLRSLAHIFPNLSVIRGQRLFYNYALVAFEMPHLEELGLRSLTSILRGGVRLEKNPRLCYIDTVDWRRVTQGNAPLDIMHNKESDLCLNVCPRHADSSHVCATRTVKMAGGGERQRPMCWTADSCQIVCPSHCGSRSCYVNPVTSQTECCSSQCVGGCRGPSALHCIACRGVFQNGGCQNVCAGNTYEFIQRRCISEDECRHIGEGNWKMLDGKCIQQCPSGYMKLEGDLNQCRKCDGPCPSVCLAPTVDSVAAAQSLKGCTVIDGILEIQVGGENNVGRELEENLGMIEEVTHFVKIVNSHAILSLQFLRSLKRIRGVGLHNKKYALWVLDNHNLQDIWDMNKHPKLTIDRGKVFFHFNRKLCLDKIRLLTDAVGLTAETTEQDVSISTNGDQVACDMSHFDLVIDKVLRNYALIHWNKLDLGDSRALLGWVINYREAPEKNINFYNARDACGSDVWKTIDVDPSERANKISAYVSGLKPYTQYGIYIQTYTIATSNRGATSSIVYFKTLPDKPTPVRDIQVENRKAKELHITWKEPNRPNGSIAHYYVYWQPQKLVASTYDRRNYCIDKMYEPIAQTKTVVKPEKNTTTAVEDGDCCVCPKSQATKRMEQHERLFQIQFENFLHNSVYKKRPLPSKAPSSKSRRKRRRRRRVFLRPLANSSSGWQTYRNLVRDSNYTGSNASRPLLMRNIEDEEEAYRVEVVSEKTSIILTNLSHYQAYSIEVFTCHEYPEQEHIGKLCSNRAIFTARTLSVESADVINHENVTAVNVSSNVSVRKVNITWQEPVSPNGLIVTYEIELAKVDAVNFKPEVYCISHKTYRRIGGYLTTQLNSGNWSYRLRATSLAGKGAWTPFMHFYVAEFSTSKQPNVGLVVGLAIGFAFIVAGILGVCIWVVAKKRFQAERDMFVSPNPDYWPSGDAYIPDEWEVPRDKIKLIRELGQGSFGMVYEGTAKDIVAGKPGVIKVAVKTVNESASFRERIDFLNEASIMKGCDCNHVVKLLGVVSKGQPTLVIMELMSNGDLKSFLREHRPDEELGTESENPPSLAEILQMAGEIADGMAYLAFKKYVHRDLAARNCMVSGDMVVKIGDFGMTRDIYETDYYRKGSKGLLPVRWMAPESLQDGLFTSQSDVWSFGVVLWEMVTLAAQPYQGLSNEQVLKYVSDGGIMERPAGCPDRLYKLMLQCWHMRAKQRPRFGDIIQMLSPDLSESFKAQSYYYSAKLQSSGAQSSSLAGSLPADDEDDDDVMDSAASSLLQKHCPLTSAQTPREDAGSEHSTLSYNSRHSPTPSPPKMAVALPLTASGRTSNAAERPSDARRTSAVSNSNSTGGGAATGSGGTNDGSKGSSQSSSSGGAPRNGLSNKHIHAYLPAMRCTDC